MVGNLNSYQQNTRTVTKAEKIVITLIALEVTRRDGYNGRSLGLVLLEYTEMRTESTERVHYLDEKSEIIGGKKYACAYIHIPCYSDLHYSSSFKRATQNTY